MWCALFVPLKMTDIFRNVSIFQGIEWIIKSRLSKDQISPLIQTIRLVANLISKTSKNVYRNILKHTF